MILVNCAHADLFSVFRSILEPTHFQNLVDFLSVSVPFCTFDAKRRGTGKKWPASISSDRTLKSCKAVKSNLWTWDKWIKLNWWQGIRLYNCWRSSWRYFCQVVLIIPCTILIHIDDLHTRPPNITCSQILSENLVANAPNESYISLNCGILASFMILATQRLELLSRESNFFTI